LQREHVPLDGLLNTAVEANREAIARKNIGLRVDLPPTPCVLGVDPARFVQVVSNLLHNATKFTEPGGSIRISARVERSNDGKPELRLSAIDTGSGISAELLPRVFEAHGKP
jgi:two-component system CheB/CheR fusion protein